MRGCHDPADVRAVGRRETRIDVLLAARSREADRSDRFKALPSIGRIGPVSVQIPAHPDDPIVDPLYVFACALSWRGQSNTSAGWELVTCLRSPGETACLAAALLAPPDNIQPPVWGLVLAIHGPGKTSPHQEPRSQKAAIRGLPLILPTAWKLSRTASPAS
jgi:hypothetical protein